MYVLQVAAWISLDTNGLTDKIWRISTLDFPSIFVCSTVFLVVAWWQPSWRSSAGVRRHSESIYAETSNWSGRVLFFVHIICRCLMKVGGMTLRATERRIFWLNVTWWPWWSPCFRWHWCRPWKMSHVEAQFERVSLAWLRKSRVHHDSRWACGWSKFGGKIQNLIFNWQNFKVILARTDSMKPLENSSEGMLANAADL